MATENLIIDKIDAFIRKYYKSRLIRGLLYSAALLLTLFLLLVVAEHAAWFGTGMRTLLFWLYVGVMAAVVAVYIVVPLLKMHRLGRRISHDEAARIIGAHFPEVKDRLLNLLQLQQRGAEADSPLLRAAIEQKTEQLRPIPFTGAVDLRANKKYIKYAAIPAAVLVALLLVVPSFVTGPSQRLLHPATVYERPAPFSFHVENDTLLAVRGSDFELKLQLQGTALPEEVSIVVEGHAYRMQRQSRDHYTYTFKHLRSHTPFYFTAAGFTSREYTLQVLAVPLVTEFRLSLTYPAYTGRERETLQNIGDAVVPEGTRVTWQFRTRQADTLCFLTAALPAAVTAPDSLAYLLTTCDVSHGNGSVERQLLHSLAYAFYAINGNGLRSDTLRHTLTVVPDAAPLIAAAEWHDSLLPDHLFFRGRIRDDYGFSRLEFIALIDPDGDSTRRRQMLQPLPLSAAEAAQEFTHSLPLSQLQLRPGDKVQYYFRVWDNDALHGAKSATSQRFAYHEPTTREVEQQLQDNQNSIATNAQSSLTELKQLQRDMEELMRNLVGKKELNWQDRQQLQQLAEKHKEVRDRLQQMQQQIQENNRLEERYRQQDEALREKQQQLDDLMNQVLTDEMKQLMQEMDRLLQQVDKNKVQEQLQQLQSHNQDIERQLDQNIELMKRLQLEKQVDAAVQKAEELSQRQQELSRESANADAKGSDTLQQKQQQLNQDYHDLQQELNNIRDGYRHLDQPEHFEPSSELQQSIEQHQKEAQRQLQKYNNSSAADHQQQAADQLQQLSQELQEQQEQMNQENAAEDAEQIRRLLHNLVQISFHQEDLITGTQQIHLQDPKYQTLIADQNKVKTDFRNLHDTLMAIAKRQVAVASAIQKELSTTTAGIERSLRELLFFNQTIYGAARNSQAATSMQQTMTSMNNLALILAESLDKMQNQQRQSRQQKANSKCNNPGSRQQRQQGSCNNPGGAKPTPKSLKEMQEALNKQMESLRKQLGQDGKQNGRTRIGQQNSMSEEFARMAAEQEQIRRLMQQYGNELKQNNPGNGKLSREIDELLKQMEQNETDLVNRTITSQTMKRQQQILSRLLEHERADLKQQQEERRQSHEGTDQPQTPPPTLPEYDKLQQQRPDLFRTTPPSLTPFYKNKVDDYFYRSTQ